MSYANIFSQTVACLFILLTLSFEEQKLTILVKFNLSIFKEMDGSFFWCHI